MREQIVEAMARGMCAFEGANWDAANFGYTPSGETPEDMRAGYMEAAQAALTALNAAGMVVVPVVPTEAMRAAGAGELFGSASDDWGDDAALVYAAMLAASPLSTPPIQAGRV